jgi:hypothetical protein
MEHHEKVVCELDQEFFLLPHPKPSLRSNHTYKISSAEVSDPVIMFELYDDEHHHHNHDNHNHDNILKVIPKLFSTKRYHGSSKMRLEISVRKFDKPSKSSDDEGVNQTPIMKVKGRSGKKLRHVLNVWDHGRSRTLNNRNKLSLEQSRMTSDYE